MRDTMLHRGPDGHGIELFDSDRVGLAHRRLAIMDLTSAGHEPMSYQEGRYWLTFNGEIYNAADLRHTLRSLGCEFRSTCDAEVLLAAYATWGSESISRFNGMWAFAVWDALEQTLFCSRDRFGIKPFYYYDDGELFIFASEIRAVLASEEMQTRPNCGVVAAYLHNTSVDGSKATFFQDINQLQPGHNLLISAQGKEEWRYWNIDVAPFSRKVPAQSDIDHFKNTFEDAVNAHMVSDAACGISLSGGLDSSSIYAIAAQSSQIPLRTYTACFDEPKHYDERYYTEQMTSMYPARGHQVWPQRDQLLGALPQMIWHLEEPPLAHGIFPRWEIAKRASGQVKVLLLGQGADEILGGYSRYSASLIKDYALRFHIIRACREILSIWQNRGIQVHPAGVTDLVKKNIWCRLKSDNSLRAESVLGPLLKNANLLATEKKILLSGQSRLNQNLHFDTVFGVLPILLKYDDKINMAFSIEGRVPFLDYRLVELAFSLGPAAKIHNGWRKSILRDAMTGLLPQAVQRRRGKIGFPTPYETWFRGPLFDEAEARILDSKLFVDGYLDKKSIEYHLKEHQNGTRPISNLVWQWLCLSTWYDGINELYHTRA